MRIAITVDPYIPVPPTHYGGIERTVDFVCRGLSQRGHRVTLFGHPLSKTEANLVAYGVPPHHGGIVRGRELWQLASRLSSRRREFDVVLSWGRLAAMLPILPIRSLPKIQRYCRGEVPWRSVRIATKLGGDSIHFMGASTSVYTIDGKVPAGDWTTVFDGVEMEKFTFQPRVGDNAPLAFVGRITPVKGTHTAVAVAKATGHRLVIAGNIERSGEDPDYFEREIKPHIDDERISYVGPVNDAQKNQLLGQSRALLFPTAFKEAFGIVIAEALACGTPVLATPLGSVREVVEEGLTGFICDNVQEFVAAVDRVATLDRAAINERCAERFSSTIIVKQLEALCLSMLSRANPMPKTSPSAT